MKINAVMQSKFSQQLPVAKQKKISFEGQDKHSRLDNYYAACLIAALLSGGVTYKCAHDELEQSRERFNKIFDKAELGYDLYDVKRDTLNLNDMNYDGFPELILYKSDGSTVVVDISNGKKLN